MLFVIVRLGAGFELKVIAVVFVVLFFGSFLVVPNSVFAQLDPLELQWSKTYDEYRYTSVFQTFDGGFLITGSNLTSFPNCLTIIKINSAGEVEWSKTYPEIILVPTLMRETASGYYLLRAGTTDNRMVYLLKVDFQGNFEWSKCLLLETSHVSSLSVRDLFVVDDESYVLSVFESYARSGGYRSRFMCYGVADDVLLWEKTSKVFGLMLVCGLMVVRRTMLLVIRIGNFVLQSLIQTGQLFGVILMVLPLQQSG